MITLDLSRARHYILVHADDDLVNRFRSTRQGRRDCWYWCKGRASANGDEVVVLDTRLAGQLQGDGLVHEAEPAEEA